MGRRGEHRPHPVPGDPADPAGWPRLVGEFCEWMGAHGYSPRTIENRRGQLAALASWLAERGISRPLEVTRPMLERYQRHLFHYRKGNGEPLSFRSQSQRLLPIRAFFRWAARANHVLYNPASEIELPRVEHRLPRPALTAAEAEQVLAQPDLSLPLGLRDRAVLEVLYSTGVRRSELAHLSLYDLDHERQTLMVRQGKGRRDRFVPLGERALSWVARYLAEVRPALASEPDDGTLFLTADGTAFSPDRLTQIARGYVEASGVDKVGACHLFRHTMATLMLEGGADIRSDTSRRCSATPSCRRPRSTPRSRSGRCRRCTRRPIRGRRTAGTARRSRTRRAPTGWPEKATSSSRSSWGWKEKKRTARTATTGKNAAPPAADPRPTGRRPSGAGCVARGRASL
jgi:integrase/recombinase XerD